MELLRLHCDGLYSVNLVRRGALGAELGGRLQLLPRDDDGDDDEEGGARCMAYCDEEGLLRALPPNVWSGFLCEQGFVLGADVRGDVLLCQIDADGLECSASAAQRRAAQAYYARHFAEAAQ